MYKLTLPTGEIKYSNKYERESNFKRRINEEYISKLKSMVNTKYFPKGYNYVIYTLPLLSLNGFPIKGYYSNIKDISKNGFRGVCIHYDIVLAPRITKEVQDV